MLAALLALALAQCGPDGPIYSCPNTMGGVSCAASCGARSYDCGNPYLCDGSHSSCGSCTDPYTCGGGGRPFRCGCIPTTCTALGAECGTVSDGGCGVPLDCGSCADGGTCFSNSCSCVPTTCVAQGKDCGAIDDGCGTTLACGTCSAPLVCGGDASSTANVCGQPDPFALTFATASEQTAMGSECTCADSVAGSGGEIVTSLRDGGAYCTAGDWLNGIPTGGLVLCGPGQLRVMSGDGTVKGFLSEANGRNWETNNDMTTWLAAASGVDPPTLYPDSGFLCPDGVSEATRVVVPAVSSSQYSFVLDLTGCQNAAGFAESGGGYVRGYSADGGIDVDIGGPVSPPRGYNYALWNRALLENATSSFPYFGYGNFGLQNSMSEPARDFLVCHHSCETSDHATSWYPGNRVGDQNQATVVVPMMSDLRVVADFLPEGAAPASGSYVVDVGLDTGAGQGGMASHIGARAGASGHLQCVREWSSEPDVVEETGASFSAYTQSTAVCLWDGDPDTTGQIVSCLDGTCADAGVTVDTAVAFPTAYTVAFGGRQDNVEFKSQPDGIVRNIYITSTARKMISFYGDSIVEERGIPQLVFRGELGRSVSVVNNGVSGYNIDQCQAAWDATVSHIRTDPSVAHRNYLLIQCGTNSLGIDAGFIVDTLKGLMTDARDAGAHPIWSTIIPRDDHCEAVQTVNAQMRGWCIDAGYPYVETWANLLEDRSDPCSGLATWAQRDSVHCNDAGETSMVELWAWGNDGGTWGGFKSPRRGPHWHSRPGLAWSPRKTSGGRR